MDVLFSSDTESVSEGRQQLIVSLSRCTRRPPFLELITSRPPPLREQPSRLLIIHPPFHPLHHRRSFISTFSFSYYARIALSPLLFTLVSAHRRYIPTVFRKNQTVFSFGRCTRSIRRKEDRRQEGSRRSSKWSRIMVSVVQMKFFFLVISCIYTYWIHVFGQFWRVENFFSFFFWTKGRFFCRKDLLKSMGDGETNVLEYLFTMFMGREAKRLYLCASNKYDFLGRGAESKDRAQKLINALRPSRGGNGIFNLETGIIPRETSRRSRSWSKHSLCHFTSSVFSSDF